MMHGQRNVKHCVSVIKQYNDNVVKGSNRVCSEKHTNHKKMCSDINVLFLFVKVFGT